MKNKAWLVVAALVLVMTAGSAVAGTVSCIGDSITERRIPWRLADDLARLTGESWNVIDHGLGGYKTGDLRGACASGRWWGENPDYVFIMAGANDAVHGNSVSHAVYNIQVIVNNMRRSNAKIIVAYAPPSGNPGESSWLESFNQLLSERLYNVDYILTDNWDDFYNEVNRAANWDLMDDRLHPNAEGQEIMAQNYADVVYSVVNDPFQSKDLVYARGPATVKTISEVPVSASASSGEPAGEPHPLSAAEARALLMVQPE